MFDFVAIHFHLRIGVQHIGVDADRVAGQIDDASCHHFAAGRDNLDRRVLIADHLTGL